MMAYRFKIGGLLPSKVRSKREQMEVVMQGLARLDGANPLAKYEFLIALLHQDTELFFACALEHTAHIVPLSTLKDQMLFTFLFVCLLFTCSFVCSFVCRLLENPHGHLLRLWSQFTLPWSALPASTGRTSTCHTARCTSP